MDKLIKSAKKEALVYMVRLAQKRAMSGSKGSWTEFLEVYDKQHKKQHKKFGARLSDPSRRSEDSLASFLKTFTQEDDLKFFRKVLKVCKNSEEVEQVRKVSPHEETAEQRLVHLTLEHCLYPIDYCFPSYEEEWMVIKHSKKSKATKSSEIIAIDCEMVLCEDGSEALVKVCAVDQSLQVKLDKVINPNKAIADYRTTITGITANDLDGVDYTLKDAQKAIKKLLSNGEILVGHSLNNDLQALKLDYVRVIDTSYIFKWANEDMFKKPSLSWLCKAMLGFDLRKEGNPHNCIDDACAAMKLILARIEGRIDDVIAEEEVRDSDKGKLLVHKIPVSVLSKDLESILPGDFTVQVKTGKKVRDTYSAFAIYKNQQAAIEAFDKLEGFLDKDSLGRPQKCVEFQLDSGISGDFCICKAFHNVSDQLINKRSFHSDRLDLETKWGYGIVGKFAGRFPGLAPLRAMCETKFQVPFELFPDVNGWILFKFPSEDARQRVLLGGPYSVYGRTLLLKPLTHDFDFVKERFTVVPVWIRLFGLPLAYWSPSSFSKLASFIGKPISTDKLTNSMARISYARVLVDVDVTKPPPSSIAVRISSEVEIEVRLEYEAFPRYCTKCQCIGHICEADSSIAPPPCPQASTFPGPIKAPDAGKCGSDFWPHFS